MSLTNRKIRCEISKTVQERQYEPLNVTMSIEGIIDDGANLTQEFDMISAFLEEKVFEQIATGPE